MTSSARILLIVAGGIAAWTSEVDPTVPSY